MKIKALILEDEQSNIDILVHFLNKYCEDVGDVESAKSVKVALEKFKSFQPDLLLLDIKLGKGTSFDLLDQIEELKIPIIFITAYDEYAIKAIKYSAIDYILKPVQIDELQDAIARAKKQFKESSHSDQVNVLKQRLEQPIASQDDFIAIPTLKTIEFIKTQDVQYVMADGKYSTFVFSDGQEIISSRHLGEYEEIFSDIGLFRVHRSYVINLNQIARISKEDGFYCIMNNGKSIPISRRKKEEMLERLRLK